MRAARGNTASDTKGEVKVAWWNTRALAAAGGGEAWPKLAWLTSTLEAQRPAVLFLFEVLGDMAAFRILRKRLRKAGYAAVFLAGDGIGQRDGVVLAVDSKQARVRKAWRVAERVLAAKITFKGEENDAYVAGIHGVTAETGELRAPTRFKAQLRALSAASGGGSWLMVGDLNYVPCQSWRRSQAPLSSADVALRGFAGWGCACCRRASDTDEHDAYLVGGDGGLSGDDTTGWTRFEGGRRWGEPTSRIDIAVAMDKVHRWRLGCPAIPERDDEGARGEVVALSDHTMQVVIRPRAANAVALRETRRMAPRYASHGEGKVRKELIEEALTAGGDVESAIEEGVRAAMASGTPAADVAMGAVRTVIDDAESTIAKEKAVRKAAAEGPRGGLASPKRRVHMYKARLREVTNMRNKGLRAEDARGTAIFHPATGMRKYIVPQGDGWQLIVRRCREELHRAQKELGAAEREAARALASMTSAWAKLPEGAVAEKQRLAYAMVRKAKAGATLSHVRRLDRADGEVVSTLSAEAEEVLREVGQINVDKSDDGAVVDACKAWHQKFVGQWPELCGADGSEWGIRKEIPFRVFRKVVLGMPNKAAGVSGVAITQLKALSIQALRVVYAAIIHDAETECISDRWHKVVYVLLEKKAPNNPEIAGERREIALTEPDIKALLQAVRRTCYSRVLGRSRPQNLGWVPGYGCGDVAQASAWLVQQARQLRQPLWMLYADLAQFFPRVHRGCLQVAELAHGLPVKVVRLAAAIYGEHADDPRVARCVYDSDGGFGGEFVNGQGTLMGCPLSTDRARLFLNSIVAAIEMTAKGVRLWNSRGEAEGDAWRRVAQLMCADDWLGCFESVKELQAAWALWALWEPITGAKLGIKAADKTVLTGVVYGEDGRAMPVPDPGLVTVDGRQVPVRPPSYAYKHLGHWRCANADDKPARRAFEKSIRDAIRRIRQMPRTVTRYQLMIVSDALMGGLADFYLAGSYITYKEAERLESQWRAVFNNKMRRARDAPRAQLYAETWVPGHSRRHLYAHGLAAVYTAVTATVADNEDLEHRAAARAGLDLTFYKWGCRQDPRQWDFSHLQSELEASLAEAASPRYLGEAWMLAAVLLGKAQAGGGEEPGLWEGHWRWVQEPSQGTALAPSAAQLTADGTSATVSIEGVKHGRRLLHAGYVRVGHFCCRSPQGWQWASFGAAARNNAALRGDRKAEAAWEAVVKQLQDAGSAPVPAERPRSAQTVWKEADLRLSPFEAATAAAPAVDPAAAAALAADLHVARAKGAWSIEATPESEARVTEWRAALDACITSGTPNAREWDHGVPNAATFSEGARVVYELGGETTSDGGQASWGSTSGFELGEDGCIVGWEDRARAMACLYDIDGEGYIVHSASGDKVTIPEVPGLPTMLQLLVRGRWALGDVEVRDCTPDKTGKSEKTHVNVQAATRALADAIRLQCQYDPTHAAATDGTKATKTGADGGTYVVIARAAVLNDGTVLGGTITEDDAFLSEHRTTYLAEKAATDDVLGALPAGSRVVLWLDSTSPQHALRRFRASPARRKRQFHAAGRHAATSALLQRHELVVYHWQMSHVGEPANEWADKATDAAADAEEVLPMVEPRHDYASMLFQRDGRSTRSWAVKRADALVAGWLRQTSTRTIYAKENDVRPRWPEPKESTVIPAVRTERCFFSDAGHHFSDAQTARRLQVKCPWGCDATCTWMHFAFECQAPEMVEQQQQVACAVADVRRAAEPVHGHEDLTSCLAWLAAKLRWPMCHGNKWVLPGGPATAWDRERLCAARRVICGHVASTGCAVHDAKGELRELCSEMATAGARMMEMAAAACTAEWGAQVLRDDKAYNVMARYARKLQTRVRRGGPARAGALRRLDALPGRVRAWSIRGGSGPITPRLGSVLTAARAGRATAHAHEGADSAGWQSWLLLARATRWRLRAWRRLGWADADPAALHGEHAQARTALEEACDAAGAGAQWATAPGIPAVRITVRQLVDRAACASRRGLPSHGERKRMAAAAALKRAACEAEAPIRSWQDGQSVRGGEVPAVVGHLDIECGHRRARPGAKRRAAAAVNRAIKRGSTADGRRCWEARRVVDVRRRPDTFGALDALIEWVSPDVGEPWADTWEPVTKAGIPDEGLRDEARAMWEERQTARGVGKRKKAAAPPPRAVVRPGGGSWGSALRGRAEASVGLARLAADLREAEEAELRRVEAPQRVVRDRPGAGGEQPPARAAAGASSGGGGDVEMDELSSAAGGDSDVDDGMDGGGGVDSCQGLGASHTDGGPVGEERIGSGSASRDGGGGSGLGEGGGGTSAGDSAAVTTDKRARAAPPEKLQAEATIDLTHAEEAEGGGGSQICGFCELSLRCLRGHTGCVARALGWGGRRLTQAQLDAVGRLCAAPTLPGLEEVLRETDVSGDGSCWVYTALAWVGKAEHVLHVTPPPRTGAADPSLADRHRDRALRAAMAGWMRRSRWAARFMDPVKRVRPVGGRLTTVWEAPTAAEQEACVRQTEDGTPVYRRARGTVARSGQYGGDTQWVAVADIFGRAVLTYTDTARSRGAGVRINLAMPTAGPSPEAGGGAVAGQGRGSWHVATLETALRVCLASKVGISAAVHVNGNHWRALLPVDGEGRPVAVTARDEQWTSAAAMTAAARWTHEHDMA